jgi:hypothetical protein
VSALDDALAASRILALRLSRAGVVTDVGAGSRALLGVAPTALIDRPLPELVHPDDAPRVHEHLLTGTARTVATAWRWRTAKDEWRRLTATWQADADGWHGVVMPDSDTDVRDELAREREAARDEAAAKARFLTQVTHELRTPLSGVIGMIDLAADDDHAASRGEHLAAARASARHLLELIDDLLDASREQAWRLTAVTIDFDLHNVVMQALAMVSPRARRKGLRLHGDVAAEPPRRRGDPLRLRQILVNLLYNAVKYTPHGQVEVRVRGDDRDSVVITVTDTGVGIDPAARAAVFEPYVQAHVDGEREGIGLGLAITRELVTLLGGTIGLSSQRGVGTEIEVTLPLPPGRVVAGDRLRAIDPTSTPALSLLPANSRPLRILVADDDTTTAAVVVAILEKIGHRPTRVADGAAAVAAVGEQTFDVALLDLEMPEFGGSVAAQRIRVRERERDLPRLPLVALSAHRHGEFEAATAGMDGYLAKPLDAFALTDLLEQIIRGQLAPPIDRAALMAKVGGRRELAHTIIHTFLEHQPTLCDGVDAALIADRHDDLQRAAHGLRGALLMVGATAAAAVAEQLEHTSPALAAPLRHRLAFEIARAGADLAFDA